MKKLAAVLLGMVMASNSPGAWAASPYHVTRVAKLAGDDGWDYLQADATTGRLYVTHGTKVQVLQSSDLSPLGEIADTPGVHGVALAADLGRGYISVGRTDTIAVFDLRTFARIREIAAGANPDAILYDPTTHQVFSFNGRGRNATVIDASDDTVAATIPLGAKPEFAATDLAGRVFVNLEDTNSIAVIDAKARTVTNTWKISGCDAPTGLAIDRGNSRLFTVCSNKVMAVIDAKSGNVVATLPIGARADGVAFDPTTHLAFASCGDGTMTVVQEKSPNQIDVVQTVETRLGARTVTLDEKTHRVYTATATYGEVAESNGQASRRRILPGTFSVLTLEP